MMCSFYRLFLSALLQQFTSIIEKPYKDSGGQALRQAARKIWRKNERIRFQKERERVMPTRAFCSFNPVWIFFIRKELKLVQILFTSPVQFYFYSLLWTYLLGVKISEGGGNIQAEVIPAKTVLLAGPHGNEVVGDQLLVSSLKFMIMLVSLSSRPNDIHKVLFYLQSDHLFLLPQHCDQSLTPQQKFQTQGSVFQLRLTFRLISIQLPTTTAFTSGQKLSCCQGGNFFC